MNSTPIAARAIALTMSILILIGTVGISADFHICQGKVKTFSFFGEAEQCSDMESQIHCPKSTDKQVTKKKCCTNETLYNTASFQSEADVISTSQTIIMAHHYPIKNTNLVASNLQVNRWQFPHPPLIRQQSSLVIAYQSFLI
ncbi:MAG: hypothetical protein ACI9AU_000263 [Bacteroidia bacterium]